MTSARAPPCRWGRATRKGLPRVRFLPIDVDGHFAGEPSACLGRRRFCFRGAHIRWSSRGSSLGVLHVGGQAWSGPDLNPCPSAKPGRGKRNRCGWLRAQRSEPRPLQLRLRGSEGVSLASPERAERPHAMIGVRDRPGGHTPLASSGSRLRVEPAPEWARVDCHQEVGERADNSEAASWRPPGGTLVKSLSTRTASAGRGGRVVRAYA